MDYNKLTLDEIKKGYTCNEKTDNYICNYCEKVFPKGQIFSVNDSLLDAKHAIIQHIEAVHEGNFLYLLHSDTKYNTLTDNQKELLVLFSSGISDSEIAKKLGVTTSTVRHQKFTFREKAKQAKLYLAIYEEVFDNKDNEADKEAIVPIHEHAVYLDDRYIITEEEKEHILQTSFTSLSPLKLKLFSPKEKKKVVILTKISEQFQKGKEYTEKEVNQILKPIYDDYATIRRYLIIYGFMERTKNGSKYWLI